MPFAQPASWSGERGQQVLLCAHSRVSIALEHCPPCVTLHFVTQTQSCLPRMSTAAVAILQSHHRHPHLHHGHQQATNQVNNNNTSSSSSAFTLQTQTRRRRFFSTSSSYRHSYILAFFLFFASILLAHFTSPISCLDSYNDLGKLVF